MAKLVSKTAIVAASGTAVDLATLTGIQKCFSIRAKLIAGKTDVSIGDITSQSFPILAADGIVEIDALIGNGGDKEYDLSLIYIDSTVSGDGLELLLTVNE